MDNLNHLLQIHRGADAGFRNKPENLARICEQITHTRYGWTMDHNPVSSSPSQRNWQMHPALKRRFLDTNVRFTSNGKRVNVL